MSWATADLSAFYLVLICKDGIIRPGLLVRTFFINREVGQAR